MAITFWLRLKAALWGILGFLLIIHTCVFAEKKVSFRTGVSPGLDYTGCGDTFITVDYPDRNMGDFRHLVSAGGEYPCRILISFSPGTRIEPTSHIKKAVLYMYPKMCISADNSAKWHPVIPSWNENKVCWDKTETGEPWKKKGGDFRADIVSGSCAFKADCHSWDVTDIVAEIIKYPHKNHGMILVPSQDSSECWYYSSESSRKEMRPRLAIVYLSAEEAAQLKKDNQDTQQNKNGKKDQKDRKDKRVSAPWESFDLERVTIPNWSEVGKAPNWVSRLSVQNKGPGWLKKITKDDARTQAKFGDGYSLADVGRKRETPDKKFRTDDFVVRIRSRTYVNIDADGSGSFDPHERVKVNSSGAAGPITVKGVYAKTAGSKTVYEYDCYIYAHDQRRTEWRIRHGGYLKGEIKGIPVKIIDANDNCIFNDYGFDQIEIDGKTLFLNRFMKIKDEWYKVDLPCSGEYIAVAKPSLLKDEQKEPSALVKIDGYSKFSGGRYRLEPDFILFRRIDKGKESMYRMDRQSKKIDVPAGRYIVYYAEMSSRYIRQKIYAVGEMMRGITVGDKPEYVLEWGLPLKLVFRVDRLGTEYTIQSKDTRVCGIAGGEYHIIGREKFFRQPVQVEFFQKGRIKAKRVMTSTKLSVRLDRSKTYTVRMIGKSDIFGTITGEKER